MSYMVIHKNESHSENYPLQDLANVLSELEGETDIEQYVALAHESDWCLSVSPNNIVVWENNLGDLTDTWYMRNVPQAKIISLWTLLAQGDIEEIKKENWVVGDPIFGI